MAWANWPVQYKRTIPSLVLLWFNIQFMSQPAIELAVGMGNYWGEPERAPPSGVAGWMFCLFVCTYCTLCCKSLAALIEHTLASCVQSKWFTRSEDMDPEQPTSSMALFLVLLPDSQFLCWNSLSKGASACWKIRRKCFICPCHLVVSYIISHVSCRAHDVLPVCSTSI